VRGGPFEREEIADDVGEIEPGGRFQGKGFHYAKDTSEKTVIK